MEMASQTGSRDTYCGDRICYYHYINSIIQIYVKMILLIDHLMDFFVYPTFGKLLMSF